MHRNWLLIVLTIVLDGLAGLTGGLLSDRWLKRHQAALIGFAAGAILSAVFLDVLPETIDELGAYALKWAFGGFVTLAFVEWLVGHHHHAGQLVSATLPPSLLISDALHNIADGAAVAAGFLISIHVGAVVAIAVIAHEVPQEVGDYALLRVAGWRRTESLFALAAVQFTAFLGAFAVLGASERIQNLTAIILSIAAGTFLYIGATDLLPELHSASTAASRTQRMFGFVSGILLIALVSAYFS